MPTRRVALGLGFHAPVQADDDLVKELALRHVQGLFSLLTTCDFRETSTAGACPRIAPALIGERMVAVAHLYGYALAVVALLAGAALRRLRSQKSRLT